MTVSGEKTTQIMSKIDICAMHEMDHESAQQAADELAADLAEKFAIEYGWDDDVIYFERTGVNGNITVADGKIHIQAQLGLLLTVLKGRIEEEIRHYLQSHFGCTFND